MSNKSKYNKIPYETIVSAVNGDPIALNQIVTHFRGFTRSKCIRIIKDDEGNERQYVDEDMQERIEAKLISSIINKFKPEWKNWGTNPIRTPMITILQKYIYFL